MRSNPTTRRNLQKRLQEALVKNPSSSELKEALNIVDDMIQYHRELKNSKGVYAIYDGTKIYCYHPPTMQCLGGYDWDKDTDDLGIIIESHLL